MEQQHHNYDTSHSTTRDDDIQGASAFCGFNPLEVLRNSSLFEQDTNQEATDHLRKFYFACQKILQNKWHAITLSDYIRKEMIPRGLRILKPPSFGKDNPAFTTAWNSVLNKCSYALMAITIRYLNEEESKIQNEILQTEQHLEVLARDNNDVLKQMEEIDLRLTEYENEIKKKPLKRTKFLRDERDYRKGFIYPWSKDTHNLTTNAATITKPRQTQQKVWFKKTHPRPRLPSTTTNKKKSQHQLPYQSKYPFWTKQSFPPWNLHPGEAPMQTHTARKKEKTH